ncbi:hypothetical protein NL676_030734 [Syzygium grande]|nr:hypothetical protein NL676_030734 [Syzygium grande]
MRIEPPTWLSHIKIKEVSTCGNDDNSTSSSDSSVTALLVFSTLDAVCGSLATGCARHLDNGEQFNAQVGYSSPAMSGIKEDPGLCVAAVSLPPSPRMKNLSNGLDIFSLLLK